MRAVLPYAIGAAALAGVQLTWLALAPPPAGTPLPPELYDRLRASPQAAALGLAALAALGALASCVAAWAWPLLPRGEPVPARWRLSLFAFVLVAHYAAAFGSVAVVLGLHLALGWPVMPLQIGGHAALLLACTAVVLKLAPASSRLALGWRAPGPAAQVLGAALQLVLFLPAFLLSVVVARGLTDLAGSAPRLQPIVQHALALLERGDPLFWALAGVAVVIAPLWEELLYRGLLYGGLRQHWGVAGSAAGSAALFALVHLEPLPLVPLYALGCFLALLRERTGSLLAPIAAHSVFNALQLVLMAHSV